MKVSKIIIEHDNGRVDTFCGIETSTFSMEKARGQFPMDMYPPLYKCNLECELTTHLVDDMTGKVDPAQFENTILKDIVQMHIKIIVEMSIAAVNAAKETFSLAVCLAVMSFWMPSWWNVFFMSLFSAYVLFVLWRIALLVRYRETSKEMQVKALGITTDKEA